MNVPLAHIDDMILGLCELEIVINIAGDELKIKNQVLLMALRSIGPKSTHAKDLFIFQLLVIWISPYGVSIGRSNYLATYARELLRGV